MKKLVKKLVVTTALTIAISSISGHANAYDRFNQLRRPNAAPTIEVNYGALQYLISDIYNGSSQFPTGGAQPVIGGGSSKGQIHAMPRSHIKPEKIITKPIVPIKGTENKPEITKKAAAPIAKPMPVPVPALAAETKTPQIVSSQKPKPQITSPTPIAMPEMPKAKAELVMPPKLDVPKLKPIEMPKTAQKKVEKVEEVEQIKQQEFPKLADIEFPKPMAEPEKKMEKLEPLEMPKAPKMPEMPEMPRMPVLPELNELATPPTPAQTSSESTVVLPPLFPNESKQIAAPNYDTVELPSLDKLLAEKQAQSQKKTAEKIADNSDSITIPPLPKNDFDDLSPPLEMPKVPAPEIANVQINNQMPSLPSASMPAKETSFSVPFNETETEFPLAEQGKLTEMAAALKANNDMALTISGYASGTAEQASQAKRTSLSRALSARRYLLENGVEAGQIVIRPYGNDSDGGVPDRVDIKLSKKLGA